MFSCFKKTDKTNKTGFIRFVCFFIIKPVFRLKRIKPVLFVLNGKPVLLKQTKQRKPVFRLKRFQIENRFYSFCLFV